MTDRGREEEVKKVVECLYNPCDHMIYRRECFRCSVEVVKAYGLRARAAGIEEEQKRIIYLLHENGCDGACPAIYDDESDQVLADYQECCCKPEIKKAIAAIRALSQQEAP